MVLAICYRCLSAPTIETIGTTAPLLKDVDGGTTNVPGSILGDPIISTTCPTRFRTPKHISSRAVWWWNVHKKASYEVASSIRNQWRIWHFLKGRGKFSLLVTSAYTKTVFSNCFLWRFFLPKGHGPMLPPKYATVRNCSNAIRILTDFECTQYYCSETLFNQTYVP